MRLAGALPTLLLLLQPSTLAAPEPAPAEQPRLAPRQDNPISQILNLASLAGIPVPTNDPVLLLSLGPLAGQLGSLLPTAPVLSALVTAAPSGFLSNIVHDPAYASSFEQEFAAGSSPSWFLGLPSDVRSYLHTYKDLPAVATAVATDLTKLESAASGAVSRSAASASAASASMSNSMTDSTSGTGSTQDLSSVSATPTSSGSASAQRTSSTSTGGAAHETGVLAVGAAAMAGILGLAVVL